MGVWTVCVSLCLLFALNASARYSGWKQYEHKFFKVFNHPAAWSDAEMTCLSHGGNLASVHSYKEYAFIKLMTSGSKSYWIGGYDAVSEGTWFWSDGSLMDYKLWNPKEPNNLHTENCIAMEYEGQNWNDLSCQTKQPYVCAISG